MTKKSEKIVLTINGEKYVPKFGLKFLNKIGVLPKEFEDNKMIYLNIVAGLMDGEPLSLLETIKASLATSDLTDEEIEIWFEESDEVGELYDIFLTSLERSNLLGKQIKGVKKEYDQALKATQSETK